MRRVSLCFGAYKNITKSGEDGATIQFPFSMADSSRIDVSEKCPVAILRKLKVSVAGGINWGSDEISLAKILFAVGKQEIAERLRLQGDLLEVEPVFIPHGPCPVDPETLGNPEGATVEVDIYD